MSVSLNTKQFSYHKDTNSFVAEISDLGLPGWPQSIALTSAKTGRVIWCELVKIARDDEGDVQFYEYAARRNDGMDLPALGEPNFTVVIFND